MNTILLLHGPNLNLLGQREPDIYGHLSIDQLNAELEAQAKRAHIKLIHQQSNHEGVLIDAIHQAGEQHIKFIVFNPAGLTHSSIALRDALLAVSIPFIEVHLSNIYQRESFRHQSYFSDIAQGVISGLGPKGYSLALEAAISYLQPS